MAPRFWHPELYQGSSRTRCYFEGWYWKHVTADLSESWSFIPGIARGERRGDGYAFVQAIEGATGRSWWFEYPLEAFSASTRRLVVEVGQNRFSEVGMHLALSGPDGSFEGEVAFAGIVRPRSSPWAPGVMGPYSFVPFMECSHGLISLHHDLAGDLRVRLPGETFTRRISFDGGNGYAEKDWGRSMPRCWIWTQSNNFPARGDSFMLSVAHIPWLGSSFTGFLCIGTLGGTLVREASWTGAKLAGLRIEDSAVSVVVMQRRLRVEARVSRPRGGILRAPQDGILSRRIPETVDAILHLRLSLNGATFFEGEAGKAGLEVVGDAGSLASRGS
jgi:tocopherol cyclase